MACCTFASAQANNHSKTTQYLPAQRNCATTTTPSARVTTLVKKDDFAPRSIADEGIEMFEVSKRFPYTPRRFQRKTVALANRQEPQPFHHAPRTRHRNFQQSAPKKQTTAVDLPARKPSPGSIPPGRTCWVSCATATSSEGIAPQKRGLVYAVSGKSAKTASDLKHMSLRIAYKGESAFVPRYIPLLDQHG